MAREKYGEHRRKINRDIIAEENKISFPDLVREGGFNVVNDGRVKMKKIHNRKYLEERRKELRKNLTPAEATLWNYLQRKQVKGRKFRRQHSIENYIVDFYCASEKLIVELDRAIHLDFAQQNYDYERTKKLEGLGLKLVRFENKQVFENIEQVLTEITSLFKK